MSKYFKDVNTLEELRRQYRDLCELPVRSITQSVNN